MMTRLRSRIYVSSLSPGSLKKPLIHCFECAPREFLFDISTLIKFGRSSSQSGNYAYRRPEVFCLSPSWIIAITYSSFISIRLSGPKIFLPNALFLLFSPANSKSLRAGKRKERINRYGLFLELCRCNSRSICHHLSLRNFALTRMNYWQKKTPIS